MRKKQDYPDRRPTTPMPDGTTHHDNRYWYKDGGRTYWSDPYGEGYDWYSCHWGVMDPLDHLWAIDTPLASELK